MRSLNKVFLMGNLGHEPELVTSKAGNPYTRLNVATHKRWLNDKDVREERTDWHSVFVWGALAERCCRYLRKGALVFVEGELTYWKVAQVEKEYKNAIHATDVKFLNSVRASEDREIPAGITVGEAPGPENLDNSATPRNHNAVAHPA